MNASDERSVSFWSSTVELEQPESLRQDDAADVVVIGAGIAGLSVAYELALEGVSVIVVDRGRIAGGMTARTTAHLASDSDDSYDELIRTRGLDDAEEFFASHAAAISRIEFIQQTEGIACDFARVNGYLFAPPGSDAGILEREAEAAHRVGLATTWIERAPIEGVNTGRALCFPGQARFHPLKYAAGLVRGIRARNGRIFGNTPVTKIEEDGTRLAVELEGGAQIGAGAVVVATNSPINDRLAVHPKQAPYRTYVVAGRVPHGSVTDALFWDTSDPYHYVRLQPDVDGDVLIVGGEDHKSGLAEDMPERLARLESWARDLFPSLGDISWRWSGQVMEPVDGAGFIGRNPGSRNVYVVTGDSGQGMTHGAMAGMLLRDLILHRDTAWAHLYDPGRAVARAAMEVVRENVDVAVNFAQYVTPGEVDSVDDLRRGQGAVVREGLGKLAAFRDDGGRLHVRSAVCTHMGCIVHWNPFERCWDCPCHGSQFAVDGSVLNGPATAPLDPAEVSAPAAR
ncbi:MAG TPA: FAD-dependent oxidoreductase [Xanthobacteraceae bacterium]|nr:FAD-dependent oxidoreductase [Xanthobacteraceae bacterium]